MVCDFLVSAFTNCVGTLFVDWVANPAKRQLDYLRHFKDNVKEFKEQKEKLSKERGRLQYEIDQADNQLLDIGGGVQDLLSKTDGILTDAESIQQEIDKDKRCFSRCPNWWWRYRLSKKLQKKKLVDISEHLKETAKFGETGRVGYRSARTIPTIEFLLCKDFMASKASEKAFREMFEALEDDKVSMIGLWGMAGSGKTTLVREVGNQAEKSKLFEKVVITTVSQKPNFEKIQDEIARFFDFDMNGDQGRRTVQELWLRLQKEKKILIILDDVWAEIDLKEKIGIPAGEGHKGCKVLLTTRSLDICHRMECQKPVQLGVLDDEEAWKLFERKADLQNSADHAVKNVAGQIAKKCKGLPIAIATVGSALKGNTDPHRWETTYRRLRDRRLPDIQNINDENVYKCLEVSFDYLKSMETKMCLLLCTLFPEDHEIYVEDLVRYAWGLELYKGVGSIDSIADLRSEVLAAIGILINSSLLLDSGESHVKMHDIVRDFCLWIASERKEMSFSIKSEVLEKWRENESFEPYTAISFKTRLMAELPNELIGPSLKILLLLGGRGNLLTSCCLHDRLIGPEASVLQTNLQTLHLEGCKLHDISILGKLTNLRTLHLERCRLSIISIVGKLSKLQALSFSESDIEELPEEIGDLNNLKLLDLSYCKFLRRIPSHLIQRLSQLEELYLHGCTSIKWATEKTTAGERFASLSELNLLENLTALSLVVARKHLPKDFVFQRLQRYDIDIRDIVPHHRKRFMDTFLHLFERDLHVSKRRKKHRINFPMMRSLRIKASRIDASCKQLFRDLESRKLQKLKLQNIVPSLEFELDQRGFNRLTHLRLVNCNMKYLIDTTGAHVSTAAFCNLVNLSLKHLPQLEGLCNGHQPQEFLQKLKTLRIFNCKKMIGAIPILENLELLEVRYCNEIQVLFQTVELGSTQQTLSQHPSLKSLKFVTINRCDKLTYLFPAIVANSLGQLEKLKISFCFELEEIIQETEVSNISLQSLREVSIECSKLRSLSSSHVHILENLKKNLTVGG